MPNPMTRAWLAVGAAACLGGSAGPFGRARADEAPDPLHENAPRVTVSDAEGVFTTNGTAAIGASRKAVFAVLMDYGQMTTFIKSLKSSRVSAHRGNGLTVVQEATGKAGPFSKDVHTVLEVTTKPNSTIAFIDTEKKDFEQYAGSWALSGSGKTTTVTYQLIAKLRGLAPEGITGDAFKKNVETMMGEVRAEAEKRAAAATH